MTAPTVLAPEHDDEVANVETSELRESSALAVLNQSEYLAMVEIARKYPRSLKRFEERLDQYANHSERVALSMFYSIPRDKKQIVGASIRFAEILVPCWGNCAAGTRPMGETRETVTSQGLFFDYENRMKIAVEVPRRITDKYGNRYGADMIMTTSNAANSVAYRNAILRGVPRALWMEAYEKAILTAAGKSKSHKQAVEEALDAFHKIKVTDWMIFNVLNITGPSEIEPIHIVTMRVLYDEVRKGDKSIEEIFGSESDKEIDALFAELKYNGQQQTRTRETYIGRSKELVEYLRGRTGKAAPAQTDKQADKKTEAKTADPVEDKKEAAADASPAQTETKSAEPETNPGSEKTAASEKKIGGGRKLPKF